MDNGSLRASDADREQAVAALREHLIAGRLTLEEFCERVDAALQAARTAELAQLQHDLPETIPAAIRPARKPARFTTAVLGHAVRRGRLRLRGWTVGSSVLGDLDFDLRDATMDHSQTTVTVLAVLGNADIYVPEGVNIDVGGLTIFGHRRDWGRNAGHPDAPSVRIRVVGLAGTIDVWRVPRDMRDRSYGDIARELQVRRRELPA